MMNGKLKKAIETAVEVSDILALDAETCLEIAELVLLEVGNHYKETEPHARQAISAFDEAKEELSTMREYPTL